MQPNQTYRHEYKYDADYGTCLALRQRLRAVMKPDAHANRAGVYTVSSIYFDNFDDKVLREKNSGLQKREKFRIRFYNGDPSFLSLEKKQKHGSLCLKCGERISRETCRAILGNDRQRLAAHSSGLVRELFCKMQLQQLKPRVLVSYTREPYIYPPGNVRITFDSDVRTSLFHSAFSEMLCPSGDPPDGADIPAIHAMDTPGQIILEVKYDAFLPEVIAHLLQSEGIRAESFSKYAACRRFG